jgi:hypothetical protein
MDFKASEVAHVLRFSSGWETTAADWELWKKVWLRFLRRFITDDDWIGAAAVRDAMISMKTLFKISPRRCSCLSPLGARGGRPTL